VKRSISDEVKKAFQANSNVSARNLGKRLEKRSGEKLTESERAEARYILSEMRLEAHTRSNKRFGMIVLFIALLVGLLSSPFLFVGLTRALKSGFSNLYFRDCIIFLLLFIPWLFVGVGGYMCATGKNVPRWFLLGLRAVNRTPLD
jgi:hypothetical protein